MDDLALGRLFRAVRIRRGWRQEDVAQRAGIARSTYSGLERGHLDSCSLAVLRTVAGVLEIRLRLDASWRGGDLGRLLSGRHSAMVNEIARRLLGGGWQVRPEVSFSRYGERGVIDLVAHHGPTGALLIVEAKTELVDIGELLATADRRYRLAPDIGRSLGWTATRIGSWIVVAEGRTNRRVVGLHAELIRAAFPEDGRSVRGWLARPDHPTRALWFLPDCSLGDTGRRSRPVKRVRAGPAGAMRARTRIAGHVRRTPDRC